MTDIRVKICGLRSPADVQAAAKAGAAYGGFVFFAKSPRNVSLEQAHVAALAAPEGMCKVSLTVDADDALLDAITQNVAIDMLQLHGSESPERVAEVRARYGLPVMKAVGVAEAGDLSKILDYSMVADQILVDAKPPKGADLPGGNGLAFDWRLVAQRRWLRPWMLAGGLRADTVGQAIALTNARQLDVSSGVESAPGVKDPALMQAFVKSALAPQSGIPRLR